MFMEEGFDEFVSKPIETMTLERVLCKVLPKSSITYVSEEKEAVKRTRGKRILTGMPGCNTAVEMKYFTENC